MPATKTSEYAFRLWGRSHHQTYLLTENRTRALIEEGSLEEWSRKVESFAWDTQLFPESGILITRLMLNISQIPRPHSRGTVHIMWPASLIGYNLLQLVDTAPLSTIHYFLMRVTLPTLIFISEYKFSVQQCLWQQFLTIQFPSFDHLLLIIDSKTRFSGTILLHWQWKWS